MAYVVAGGTHRTWDGRIIRICEMSNDHLGNALRYYERNRLRYNKLPRHFPQLEAEAKRRGMNWRSRGKQQPDIKPVCQGCFDPEKAIWNNEGGIPFCRQCSECEAKPEWLISILVVMVLALGMSSAAALQWLRSQLYYPYPF